MCLHNFIEDFKTGTVVCTFCGYVKSEILIENVDKPLTSNDFYSTKKKKFINQITDLADYLNLAVDSVVLAKDIYLKYTENNREKRFLPIVCLFISSNELGYLLDTNVFLNIFQNYNSYNENCNKKFKSCYERVDRFLKNKYTNFLNIKEKTNKTFDLENYYYEKFKNLFTMFIKKFPLLNLTNKDYRIVINNLVKITNDVSLTNKSEKGNFLVCLLNYEKCISFFKIHQSKKTETFKLFNLKAITFNKINQIFNKIQS